MTLEEKANLISKLSVAINLIPENQQDHLAMFITGYSMMIDLKQTKEGN